MQQDNSNVFSLDNQSFSRYLSKKASANRITSARGTSKPCVSDSDLHIDSSVDLVVDSNATSQAPTKEPEALKCDDASSSHEPEEQQLPYLRDAVSSVTPVDVSFCDVTSTEEHRTAEQSDDVVGPMTGILTVNEDSTDQHMSEPILPRDNPHEVVNESDAKSNRGSTNIQVPENSCDPADLQAPTRPFTTAPRHTQHKPKASSKNTKSNNFRVYSTIYFSDRTLQPDNTFSGPIRKLSKLRHLLQHADRMWKPNLYQLLKGEPEKRDLGFFDLRVIKVTWLEEDEKQEAMITRAWGYAQFLRDIAGLACGIRFDLELVCEHIPKSEAGCVGKKRRLNDDLGHNDGYLFRSVAWSA